ncbi:substrate-binding domain-containing protein [candidate division KSB1 bacterium]|nr:substrate-binding domain-containing protein [candidate division KSB1 bacterium]RQW11380.1 MAG: sugar ABC transporter substrate-binding protein [candidate division KSB1 bacterium]
MQRIILFISAVFILSLACSHSSQVEIALIPKGTDIMYWKGVHAGGAKAAHELGVKLLWQGPQKESDREQQINIVQNFISRGVDAIVLAPLDEFALMRPVSAAVKRNIPVVIVDSGLQGHDFASYIATDNYAAGELAAQKLTDLLGGAGDVFLVRFNEGSNSTGLREEGFLAWIRDNAPAIRLVSTDQYSGATMELALQTGQNLLNKFPNVKGIFCPNEATTFGLMRALQTAGKAKSVKLVGFDYTDAVANGIRTGEIAGVVVQDPFRMGYEGVKTAYAALQGEIVPLLVKTDVIFVTAENMNDPDIRAVTEPEIARWLDEK